jgi:tungstate transport system ATP-binding protein
MLDRLRQTSTFAAATRSPAAPAVLPLAARELVYEAGGRRLIDGIDLDLTLGALSVVMGQNGAGKSLLLRLLHGLIAPTAGRVLWGNCEDSEQARTRQAMVFQRPVLLRRSVGDNVGFVLRLVGQDTPDRRAEILDHVGLLDRIKQPARLLSGGEQQRLALARALTTNPDILFLDEPTASLDPASTMLIENIVLDAHRQGTKIVFVTHDLGQARRLAGDVVFLHGGQVAEHTPASRFFTSPASEAASAYLDGRLFI